MKSCPSCKTEDLRLDHKYDAYYCPTCLVWTEEACSDQLCEFCSERPERPTEKRGTE